MTRTYLRPVGLLTGESAAAAVVSGAAGRIAGGTIAFAALEIIERDGNRIKRALRTYSDFSQSSEALVREQLIRIESPRTPVTRIDFARLPITSVMGIINVTPDSFSDGGENPDTESALASAQRMAEEGAHIIDVGGESTRPGSEGVPVEEEARRVLPVIEELHRRGLTVSIDTRKPEIMEAAVTMGASLINDVSALRFDRRSAATVARLSKPTILMHAKGDPKTMQLDPHYEDVLLDTYDFLDEAIAKAEASGILRSHLLADPGLGFGKTFRHNLEILNGFTLYHGLGVSLVAGSSRKAFIGALTGEKAARTRVSGSIGAALAAAQQGAQILRVHDVRETVQALKVWHAVAAPENSGL